MFLTVRKKGNKGYLYLLEGVYDKSTGKCTNKIVKSFGCYDKLPEEIRKNYEDERARKELAKRLAHQRHDSELRDIAEGLREVALEDKAKVTQKNNFNRTIALRYGHLCLKPIWEKQMGLKYKIDYLQRQTTQIETWRMNDLLFYLCTSKVLEPNYHYLCNETKSNYFYCPWNNIVQDNFYRGLDFVYENGEKLIKHAVRNQLRESQGDVKAVFITCTNTWFETSYDNVTRQTLRFSRQKVKELNELGINTEQVDAYLDSEDFFDKLSEELRPNLNISRKF